MGSTEATTVSGITYKPSQVTEMAENSLTFLLEKSPECICISGLLLTGFGVNLLIVHT